MKIKYINFCNGQLGNQLYYVLQAYIRSNSESRYVYSMRTEDANRGIYHFICRLGLSEFVTTGNPLAVHEHSYMQEINKDFSMSDVERLIDERILKSAVFKDIQRDMHADDDKVSLHIRNGDFLLESKNHHYDCFNRIDYIKNAIGHHGLRDINHIVVFSDDIPLCKREYHDILSKRFQTVEYNKEPNFENEFRRLSLFKNRINWNSTFSFWTAFIGNVVHHNSGVTICPSMFSRKASIYTRIDPRWTVLKCIPFDCSLSRGSAPSPCGARPSA